MTSAKKELSKFLESYENSAEDFYQQMKNYYRTGIVTSMSLPFLPQYVQGHPEEVVKYLLEYKILAYSQPNNLNETLSILFELGPVLFQGDQVEVLILDQKITTTVPAGLLEMDRTKQHSYTVRVKLLASGPVRTDFEKSINRDHLAQYLKDRLKSGIYVALRSILFDGFSDRPDKDLEMCNVISQPMGVMIKEPQDVERILEAPHNNDLGLRDLEELYVLHDLLQDENWWVFQEVETLREELKTIIHKSRQLRIDSPIVAE
jgi:hypothetical protein